MATILEQYLQLKSATGEQMASGTLPCDKVFTYQEILYRISVLESCQAFCKTAPITARTKLSNDMYVLLEPEFSKRCQGWYPLRAGAGLVRLERNGL